MRALRVALLIVAAATSGCASRQQPSPPNDDGHWIALPREAPSGQLVSWAVGPFVFVMRYDDVLASVDSVLGDTGRHAAIREALLSYENDPDAAVLPLNDVIGESDDLQAVFGFVLANLLEDRRVSLIDMERGFVIGSVQQITNLGHDRRSRSFLLRDGREVLRVTEEYSGSGLLL